MKKRLYYGGKLTKSYLEKLYVDKDMTMKEIAENVGCSLQTIFLYFKKLGIKPRNRSQAATLGMNKYYEKLRRE